MPIVATIGRGRGGLGISASGQFRIFDHGGRRARAAPCTLFRRFIHHALDVCFSLVLAAGLIVFEHTSAISPARAQAAYETATKPTATECRPEGGSQYTSQDYGLLADMLAYDRGRGFMSIHVMTTKVSQLVQDVEFNSLKILFRACAPQFVERSLGDVLLPKKNIWRGKLTRSEVVLYDDGHQFLPDVIVLLTGLP
jgi:hypothetical protein